MKYTIILILLSLIIVSSITFDNAFASHPKSHIQNEDPLINQHSIDIQNTSTIINFTEGEYSQDDTLNFVCEDSHLGVAGVKWFIKNTDTGKITTSMQSQTYSFLGSELEVGNYSIKCRIGFGDTHRSHSEWVEFSIINEIVVDLAQHPQITNYVDINYNPTIHNVVIEWDFGVYDDRTCYTKTDFGIDYMINGTTLTHAPYHTFFGDDITLYDISSMSTNEAINEDKAIISCQGELSFNITDFEILNDFSGFEFWMTFYEKINNTPYILNEVGMIYSEDVLITPYPCFDSTINLHTSIYYDTTKHLKMTDADMFQNGCNSVNQQYDGIIPVSYTTVDSIIYEPYPPQSNIDSSSTEKKNNNGSGCSSDCTAPTIGVDKNGIRFVEDGLKLNGITFDGDYFKTHMPMQYTEIGKINHLSLKVYENSGIYNIDMIQFGIVKEIGSPINLAEPRIEIDVSNFANDVDNPSLDGFILIDKEEIISYYDVTVSTISCMDNSNQECLQLDIYWSFDKVPEFNVLAINGWDNNKNPFNNYFNDGLTTIDLNYVEPIPEEPYKYVCNDPSLDSIQVWNRMNCNFAEYKIQEAQRAMEYSKELWK